MKASMKQDILLTFLNLVSIFMVIGCTLFTLINAACESIPVDDPYSTIYERKHFSSSDISLFEDMFDVKFPKDTQFIEFSGNQDRKTGDTEAMLSIKLPDSERDKFAESWFQKHPNNNLAGSLNQYFANTKNILTLTKIYYNHSGDTLLKRFEKIQIISPALASIISWIICIVVVIFTVALDKKYKKMDRMLLEESDETLE